MRGFKVPKGVKKVNFSTRSLRDDLLERMRLLAMQATAIRKRRVTLEEIANDCIAAGLAELEPEMEAEYRTVRRKKVRREAP